MKKQLNRKAFFITISVLFVIIIIIVSSFLNAGVNPKYWFSNEFLGNLILTISICIFGVIAGNSEGDNFYRNNPNGLFTISYNDYNASRDKINNIIDKFSDWNENYYKKEYYKKCIRYLKNDNGIKQAELLLQLDRSEILKLTEPKSFLIDGNERYFNSLSLEQINAILNVLDGKIKVNFVHESFFLNAYSKSKNKSMYEQASEQEKSKRNKFTILMVYRIIFSILIGLIFAGLQIDKKSGVEAGQSAINLFGRLFTLFSSIGWGFFISNDMIKDEIMFIDYKKTILDMFYLDVEVNKTFISLNEEEKAKEKIDQIRENKNKERENE